MVTWFTSFASEPIQSRAQGTQVTDKIWQNKLTQKKKKESQFLSKFKVCLEFKYMQWVVYEMEKQSLSPYR